jgi:Coenzyme PQQ synthesis protein D (PqqD)
MNRSAIPKQTVGYESADLDGEFMLYHSDKAKALYLNETASLIWKLCDGERSVESIETLLRDAYPDAGDLPHDVDAAFRVLVDEGAVEIL